MSMRYALADWGKLPLNPAIGAGRRFNSGADDHDDDRARRGRPAR